MLSRIDVIYHNGEVIGFCNHTAKAERKTLMLTRNLECDLEFRFCNRDGEPERVIAPERFGKAQALLTSRDRVLAVIEENLSLYEDEMNFQILKIEKLVLDSDDLQQVLADSYLELEPRRHGTAECEFSVAIFADGSEQTMQLFFTVDALVKNPVLA